MKNLIIVLLFTINQGIVSQSKSFLQSESSTKFISFSNSKSKKTNGLRINYWSDYKQSDSKKKIKTNGIELGINPIGVFIPFLTVFHFSDLDKNPLALSNELILKEVNGLQVGFIISEEKSKINGLNINLTGNFNTIVNGVSISPTINKHYKVAGISLSPIANFDKEVNGIQISLWNKTNKLKGIQIGLWNKNEKRSLPIINWNF